LPILFPFFFFQCKPTKGLYQHIYSKPNTKSCQRSTLVVSGWIEGRKRSLRPNPAEPSPLSLFFNQPPPSTPSSRSPPCRNPSTSPTSQRHGVSTPCRPCRRHAHRGCPTGAEQHRPPPVMSPRRRAPLRAHDQFPGHRHLGPTLRRALAMPLHRVFAAQSAQTAPCVPVHAHMCTFSTVHDRARRPAHDAKPPSPCPLTDRTDPGRPGFRRARTEPETPLTGLLRHRHRHPYAWTRLTTPSRDTALAV
jgi:hypothetical protein